MLGDTYNGKTIDYSKVNLNDHKGRAGSMPWDTIYMSDTMASQYKKSVFGHEMFHQFQYQGEGKISSFFFLALEFLGDLIFGINPYDYGGVGNIENITSLDDIDTKEGQAQFVEDFINLSLGVESGKGAFIDGKYRSAEECTELASEYATVLKNSGMSSEAITKATED